MCGIILESVNSGHALTADRRSQTMPRLPEDPSSDRKRTRNHISAELSHLSHRINLAEHVMTSQYRPNAVLSAKGQPEMNPADSDRNILNAYSKGKRVNLMNFFFLLLFWTLCVQLELELKTRRKNSFLQTSLVRDMSVWECSAGGLRSQQRALPRQKVATSLKINFNALKGIHCTRRSRVLFWGGFLVTVFV